MKPFDLEAAKRGKYTRYFFISISNPLKVEYESYKLLLFGFSIKQILEIQRAAFFISKHTIVQTDYSYYMLYKWAVTLVKIGYQPNEILIYIKKYARKSKPPNLCNINTLKNDA